MRFLFGLPLDGGTWPDVPGDRDAVAGERWGGPMALLALLEGQLGLGSPSVPTPLRAASLIGALDVEGAFWQASASADPFATAMQLIRWDEALRLHGWRGEPVSTRLGQLAGLMNDAPPGPARRYEAVLEALSDQVVVLEAIELVGGPREALPLLYRRVLDALEARGCGIVPRATEGVERTGDLAGCLDDGFEPAGTGELQLVRPRGPLAAAEAMSVWLAQLGDLSSTVVIGGDDVLDAALRRHGVPVLGASRRSGSDPLLQVLPLVVALGWRPQDPAAALELLTLPETPAPGGIARRLDRALREWPAVGSETWNEAMDTGLEAIEDETRRGRVTERLGALLDGAVDGGEYPVAELNRRLDALTTWLQGRRASSENAEGRWTDALTQVAAFRRLVAATEAESLSRPLLGRLLRHATEQVATQPAREAEAGLVAVSDPGAVVGPVQRVVWWGFTERQSPVVRQLPLTPEERQELGSLGAAPPDPGEQAELLSAAWRRPLQMASGAVVLVCPQFGTDGEPEAPHPLWDEITAGLEAAQESRLIGELPRDVTADRVVTALPVPTPRREWRVATPDAIRLPERFSPTSMNKLIANPLYWVLEYAARLSAGRGEGLPAGVLMMGRIAHEIIGRLLSRRRDGEQLTPDAAATEAGNLFGTEGPRLAADFFVAGRERECAELERHVVEATRDLFRHLDETNASVAAVEESREAEVDGVALRGRPDLELTAPDTILDIKWGRAGARRDELAEGGATQLAVYTRLANPAAAIGYYILREQVPMVTGGGLVGAETVDGPSPRDIWAGTRASLAERLEQLRQGIIEDTCADVEDNEPPGRSQLTNGKLVVAPQPAYSPFAWASEGGSLA